MARRTVQNPAQLDPGACAQCGLQGDALLALRGCRAYESGERCRRDMARLPQDTVVFVGGNIPDVSPLNLVAALHKDNPARVVYLVSDVVNGSLATRADAAGAAGIVSTLDVARMCGRQRKMLRQWDKDTPRWGDVDTGAQWIEPNVEAADGVAEGADAGRAPAGSLEEARQPGRPRRDAAQGNDATQVLRRVEVSPQHTDRATGAGACILVASGRGGTGKSTISVLLAALARAHGLSAGLADLDAQFSDLVFLSGSDPSFVPVNVAADARRWVGQIQHAAPDAIPVAHVDKGPEYAEQSAPCLIEALRAMRLCRDVVVANAPTGWTELHADALDTCDVAVLVMDQRPASVQGCIEARDLCLRMGVPSSKLVYVLNGCSQRGQITSFDCALSIGSERVFEVSAGGDAVSEALSAGLPGKLLEQGNLLAASLDAVLLQILSMLGVSSGKPAGPAVRAHRPRGRFLFHARGDRDVVAR